MANPHSVITRARLALAQWLDPHPDPGEAWCMGCKINGGRTVVLNAHGHREHVYAHRDESSGKTATSISMRVNYGQVGDSVDGEEP